jgi:hypothetical protein
MRSRKILTILAVAGLASASAVTATAISASASTHPVRLAAPAMTAPRTPKITVNLPAGVKQACPQTQFLDEMQCESLIIGKTGSTAFRATAAAAPVKGTLSPANLRSAYELASASKDDGKGTTVAIVDAYKDSTIAADLAKYRSEYDLGACTTSGKSPCLRIVGENGTSSLPSGTNAGWSLETSLDVDMVSAICPNCKILLVEANSDSTTDLGTANSTAVRLGAKFVSNSWSSPAYPGDSVFDTYFRHPGVVDAFAAGDYGYGVNPESSAGYPASSQFTVSVGGTDLSPAKNSRGWTETAWGLKTSGEWLGTGSGCAPGDEGKPTWQTDTLCQTRTENDVSAFAYSADGVAVYNSSECAGWCGAYGTSAATPIITSVYALAGTPAANTYPSSYLYQSGHSKDLFHVSSGSNGTCESYRKALCNATASGYNGPTGLGTPDGIAAFRDTATGDIISVTNPGHVDSLTRTSFKLTLQASDSKSGKTLHYAVSGLPSGLHASGDAITGTTASGESTSSVTVTVTDGTGAKTTVHFTIVVNLEGDKCLAVSGSTVVVDQCADSSTQLWTVANDDMLEYNGKCLDVSGASTLDGADYVLATCNTSRASQAWGQTPLGDDFTNYPAELWNVNSEKCGTESGGLGSRAVQTDCYGTQQDLIYLQIAS